MQVNLDQAEQIIQNHGVVAVPTETVYGLAASIDSPVALKKIFSLKNRPIDNPLIVHFSNLKQITPLIKNIPKEFTKLQELWPGPLTVVLSAEVQKVSQIVRAGLSTLAIRMPHHKDFLNLIQKTGPLAAPSANLSGKPSATIPEHVEEDFGKDFPVLYGGPCSQGVESTVIQLHKDFWEILRFGSLDRETIQKTLGKFPLKDSQDDTIRSPGQKYRHYAPNAQLKLFHNSDFTTKKFDIINFDAVLGFDDTKTNKILLSLGTRDDFKQNLKNLYRLLRQIDKQGLQVVLVDMNFQPKNLGATLYERLKKAANHNEI